MKKVVLVITVISILFSSFIGVSADSDCKYLETAFNDLPAVVKAGEAITFIAASEKHGSSYEDGWNNAVKIATELDPATECYISKAVFTAEKPGIYNISYTIRMTAGNSDVVFMKNIKKTIEVVSTTAIVGAAVKDLKVTPVYDQAGSISAYSASGTVHALWSDGTSTPNGAVYFFFNPEETSRELEVTLYVDGQKHIFTVTVNR